MHSHISKNRLLLGGFLVFLLAGFVPVLLYSKAEVHLFLNRFHSPFWDQFFTYATFLGSGYMAVMVSLIFLPVRIRYVCILICAWACSGIIVQFLKHVVFPGFDRPLAYFRDVGELYIVHGVKIHKHFSFPSGHAATAMAIFTMLAMITRRKWLKLVCLFTGIIVVYSRVYLSQHFLEDILLGSLLGILALIIFYWYFHRLKTEWLDKPVQYYFRQKNDKSA